MNLPLPERVKLGQATPTANVDLTEPWRARSKVNDVPRREDELASNLTSRSSKFCMPCSIDSAPFARPCFLSTTASPAQILTALRISGAMWIRFRCRE